jgi:hypothetical protein
MPGGLDDALARMARREELRRRATQPAVGTAQPAAAGTQPAVGTAQPPAGAVQPPGSPGETVEELVQAARRAVVRDPDLAVMVTVTYRGRTSAVQVREEGGEVTVTVTPVPPEPPREVAPPEPPREVAPPEPPSAASQLAELLRQSNSG